jgi:iron-sulfur cluster assembly protein
MTPRAVAAALGRAREAGVDGWFFRVAVVAGGCSGLCYELFFVERPGPEDLVVACGDGLTALVDPSTLRLLAGTVIDLGRGPKPSFLFSNPRARTGCSCGASFAV